MDEIKLEEIVAGIEVTSDWVVVTNKNSACKGELLAGQYVIVHPVPCYYAN